MSICVFASGNGSNFEQLVDYARRHHWQDPITLLFCDKPDAFVIERAKKLKVPFFCCNRDGQDIVDFETDILHVLHQYRITWIVLAGYMRMLRSTLLHAYPRRILNIHPSLLPAFPGRGAIECAFSYPVKVSGITVHYVDEGMDTGEILAQVPVYLSKEDTLDTFKKKIQEVEHTIYPRVVEKITQK